MAKSKVVVITKTADGKETRKEEAKCKLVKIPKGMLRQVQVDIIKKQREKKNETKDN